MSVPIMLSNLDDSEKEDFLHIKYVNNYKFLQLELPKTKKVSEMPHQFGKGDIYS